MCCVASAKSSLRRSTSCCQCSAISDELHKPLCGMYPFSSFDIFFPFLILSVLCHSSLSRSQYGVETLHTVITNEDARLGCAPFRNADLCWEEAGDLRTAAPAEGADLRGLGRNQRRARLQETDAERTKQGRAQPPALIHQTKQQMHRAYAFLSLAPPLLPCQEDHLFGAGCEQLERIG